MRGKEASPRGAPGVRPPPPETAGAKGWSPGDAGGGRRVLGRAAAGRPPARSPSLGETNLLSRSQISNLPIMILA